MESEGVDFRPIEKIRNFFPQTECWNDETGHFCWRNWRLGMLPNWVWRVAWRNSY